MSRRRLLLALAAVLLTLGLVAPGAVATPRGVSAAAVVAKRPGQASDHTWLFSGKLLEWSGCRPLTYRVNASQAPDGWRRTLVTALRKASQATGFRFRYLGRTSKVITAKSTAPRGTDFVVGYYSSAQTDFVAGNGVLGQGGASSDGRRLFNGKVALNGPELAKMADGFGAGPEYGYQGTRGGIVMHEIGHMLGLGHAKSPTQIMYPSSTHKPAEWGAGDFAGLRTLGHGCGRGSSSSRVAATGPAGPVESAYLP